MIFRQNGNREAVPGKCANFGRDARDVRRDRGISLTFGRGTRGPHCDREISAPYGAVPEWLAGSPVQGVVRRSASRAENAARRPPHS